MLDNIQFVEYDILDFDVETRKKENYYGAY